MIGKILKDKLSQYPQIIYYYYVTPHLEHDLR